MTMSAREYLETVKAPAKRRHKYGAVPAYRCKACGCDVPLADICRACGDVNPIRFASQAEARRYDQLMVEVRARTIHDLKLQEPFPIEVRGKKVCTYVSDFSYRRGAEFFVEDVKGIRTPLYRLKKKLVEALYGIKITEV
jgi:hypothetical protein